MRRQRSWRRWDATEPRVWRGSTTPRSAARTLAALFATAARGASAAVRTDMDRRILRFRADFATMKAGGVTRPAMATVFLAYGCNFHCPGCHYNAENEHGWQTIEPAALLRRLAEARAMGLQAVIYSGGGEPLFHKEALEIFSRTYALGVRVGTLTNGSRLLRDRELRELLFARNEFVRISAYPETDLAATRALTEQPHQAQLGLKLLIGTKTVDFNRDVIRFMRDAPWHYIEIKAERESADDLAQWDARQGGPTRSRAESAVAEGQGLAGQGTHRAPAAT